MQLVGEVAQTKLARREIHRNRNSGQTLSLPALQLAAGLVEHPFAQRHHQTGVLGQRDESARDRSAHRPSATSPAPRRRTAHVIAGAKLGLVQTTSSSRSSPRRNRASSSSRSRASLVSSSLYQKRKVLRPPAFDSYIAASALRIRPWQSCALSG